MNDTGIFADDKVLGESSYFQECFLKMFSTFFCIKNNDKESYLCFYVPSKNKAKSQKFHWYCIFDHNRNTISVLLAEETKKRDL